MSDVLALPITAVTCLEDRAQVTRSGPVTLAPGVHRLRIGPVTPLAVDRTLRAELRGLDGEVVDARVVRAYTPPAPGELPPGASDAAALIRELDEQESLLTARQQRAATRLAVAAQARADVMRAVAEFAAVSDPTLGDHDPADAFRATDWGARLDLVGAEEEARHADLHAIGVELRRVRRRRDEAARVSALVDAAEPVLRAEFEIVVSVPAGGTGELAVDHLVPCALWRPAYRATLGDDGKNVRIEADAVVWQNTGEDWPSVRLALSTARPTQAARPPELDEDVLVLRERTAEERRTVDVSLREEDLTTVGTLTGGGGGGPDELPGVDDGGEVRVLTAPGPVRVPSDGRPHRVRLTTFETPCECEHACTPELSPLVAEVVRFTNEAGHVLLAGPVDLVRGSGFTGRGQLRFAAAGERVRLPFGADDTVRVVRKVDETRNTTALTGRTVITRTVRVFLSHIGPAGDAPVPVVLRERVPVSEVGEVEVRVLTDRCAPAPEKVDADGIARWAVTLAPGERREVVLTYEITASGKVSGL